MGANDDRSSGCRFHTVQQVPGDAQFRRSAPPEQIRRGRGRDSEIGPKKTELQRDLIYREPLHLAIDEKHLMAFTFQQLFCVPVFQRKMRFTATEVDTSFETPIGIDQSNLHDACLTRDSGAVWASSSQ